MQIDSGCLSLNIFALPVMDLCFYFAPQPRIEPIYMRMSGGHSLPAVQPLVASSIFFFR